MSKLIVFTYDDQQKAVTVLQSVAELSKEHLIEVQDAAVIVKNANGKVKVQQTLEAAIKGSNVASGGFWGLLIGLIFGGPIFMAVLGMGLSALFGRKLDIGIDKCNRRCAAISCMRTTVVHQRRSSTISTTTMYVY